MKFLIFVLSAMGASSSIIEGNYNNQVIPINSTSAAYVSTPTKLLEPPPTPSNIMNVPPKPTEAPSNLTETNKTTMNQTIGTGVPPMSTTSKSKLASSSEPNMSSEELIILSQSQEILMNNTTWKPMASNATTPAPNGSKSSASTINSISILLWSTALGSFLYTLN